MATQSGPLPIGVVLPTLNCAGAVEAHLEASRGWLARVAEVVVVDSHSTDGTFERLRSGLGSHPGVRFFQRPRGLFAAWNYGVSQVTANYTYISTIRDTITEAGLEALARGLETTGADLVVSPPEFTDEQGRRLEDQVWPIHRLLAACPVDGVRVLEPWQALTMAVLEMPQGLMGSSASNLYRTGTLQRFPFPVDYRHAGDSAWGIAHALETRMAVSPRVVSRFVMHENANTGLTRDAFREVTDRFHILGQERVEWARANAGMTGAARAFLDGLPALLGQRCRIFHCQLDYETRKKASRAWFLHPRAWLERAARNRERAALRSEARRQLERLGWLTQPAAPGDFDAAFKKLIAARLLEI